MNSFYGNYSIWYVKQTTKVQKQFQLNINQPDTVNYNQKIVLKNAVYCKSSSWEIESRNQRIRSTLSL